LLAEDNLPDALLVREAIRRENLPLDLHVVSDGQQVIDFVGLAETNPEAPCPQFLLLDLNLPKIEGFEVLRRLRANAKFKKLPVLIISSSDSPADRRLAAELGADYFRKPANYEEYMKLGAILKRLIADHEP
jgi:DNA-binding response OmpR family regulator